MTFNSDYQIFETFFIRLDCVTKIIVSKVNALSADLLKFVLN